MGLSGIIERKTAFKVLSKNEKELLPKPSLSGIIVLNRKVKVNAGEFRPKLWTKVKFSVSALERQKARSSLDSGSPHNQVWSADWRVKKVSEGLLIDFIQA